GDRTRTQRGLLPPGLAHLVAEPFPVTINDRLHGIPAPLVRLSPSTRERLREPWAVDLREVATAMSERSIFMEALEFDVPRERAAYIRRACGGDERLRARVEALLRRHQSDEVLALDPVPDVDLSATADLPPAAEQPGTVIGPYKLLEQIGEGGMGVVFMAEQTGPMRRKVALKIIKPGMDTKQVIARFEAERQA